MRRGEEDDLVRVLSSIRGAEMYDYGMNPNRVGTGI